MSHLEYSENGKFCHFEKIQCPLTKNKCHFTKNVCLLHRIIPHTYDSPCCIFCSPSVVDNPVHFLYSCPFKWNIWLSVWSYLILSAPSVSDIHHAIFSLQFPQNPSSYSSHIIIACILKGIWVCPLAIQF